MKFTNKTGLSFEINKNENTATVIDSSGAKGEISIPRSIIFKSQEFVITSIGQNSFKRNKKIKSVTFSDDSLVFSISNDAFSYSSIEKISLPQKLTEIGDSAFEWCQNLSTVNIPEKSTILSIGKNAFSHSSIVTFSIPYQITEIREFTFSYCERMKTIEIPVNSSLRSIHKYAFSCSSLESIFIPKSVQKLEEGWCAGTSKLNHFSVSKENKLFSNVDDNFIVGKSETTGTKYDQLIFSRRNIEEAKIPTNIQHIKSYCFSCCNNLKTIYFDPKSIIKTIDKESFSFSTLEYISIPNEVNEINESAFSYCKNLKKVDISENSNLLSIKKEAFSSSSIEEIFIPSKVTEIKEGTFSFCEKLKTINITENSSIISICKDAFSHSSLEDIFIPKSVQKLEEGWCAGTSKLNHFSVSKENKLFSNVDDNFIVGKSEITGTEYDQLIFSRRNIEEAKIPTNIQHIKSYCFSCCNNLKTIYFDPRSIIKTIDKESFSFSTLEHISIPNEVNEINEGAFMNCSKLKTIHFHQNSSLNTINKDAFANSALECISIPSSITEIKENAFSNCENLKEIKIPFNSSLNIINKEAFIGSPIEKISFPSFLIYLLNETIKNHKIKSIEIIDENIHINSFFCIQCITSITFPNAKEIIVDKKCGKFALFVPIDCDLICDESTLKEHEIKYFSPKELMKIEILETELIESLLQNNEPFGNGLISKIYKVKFNHNKTSETKNSPKKKKVKKMKKAKLSTKNVRALKVFSNNNDVDKMKHYVSQYELLNSLNHRHIIKVFGFFNGDENFPPCILEEYFKSNLESSIKKLKEIDLVSIIYEISLALKTTHQKGIIHRDLKPTNILIDTENHAKICDFNYCELMNIENQINEEIKLNGNKYIRFFAPEIINKEEKIDEKIDVYSFGAIMFYILTKGDDFNNRFDDLIKNHSFPININKISCFLIEKCLSISPNERLNFIQIDDIIVKNQLKLIDGIENEISILPKHEKQNT